MSNVKRIDLVEWQDISDLDEYKERPFLDIFSIPKRFMNYFDIIEVSKSGIRLRAKSYVGIFPINEKITITINPKTPIEDFLYILYHSENRYIKSSDFDRLIEISRDEKLKQPNIFNFLIITLIKLLDSIKSCGFFKESVQVLSEDHIKGKILVKQTLYNHFRTNVNKIVSQYFDLTKNNYINGVIKYTLFAILETYSNVLPEIYKQELFDKYLWFKNVDIIKRLDIINEVEKTIIKKQLPNSREYYYDILNICLLFLKHSDIDYNSNKEVKITSFAVDMNKVFT